MRLLVRDIQTLAEDFSVSAGLVKKVHKIAVFKDVLDLWRGKQVLDVLRNSRGDTAPFTKAFPVIRNKESTMGQNVDMLRSGFETAFINGNHASNAEYKPIFVTNRPDEGKK